VSRKNSCIHRRISNPLITPYLKRLFRLVNGTGPIYHLHDMQIDISPYILRSKQRKGARKAALKRRHDRAWAIARTAAELLRNSFGAKRIVVFGSLTQEDLFHPGSDVDLAVWGLCPDVYFRSVGQLQALDPSISIDLVMFEEAPESLRRVILKGGIDL
jgi:predicted nucleotidyltransferase